APNAAARRAERLAVAQALGDGPALTWAQLGACPPWLTLPADARELLCAHAGAWWLAASLRACIDGKRLARVRELLGEQSLTALLASPRAQRANALGVAPRPLLPPPEATPAHLMACGRALLAWHLPPALRPPLLAHLGWQVDEGHTAAFDQHRDWARQALQAALSPTPEDPAPEVGEPFGAVLPAGDADALVALPTP
ncbi:MAG: hypothetical protein Q4G71_17495, partial [Pseudomonadota bacterium]|nr:hypothetical protein [Pseudomonadota bacterium]